MIGGTASTRMTYLQTPSSSGELSFGYDYNAYGPADPLPIADPTAASSSQPEIGPDANVFLSWYFSNVHSWHYSISGRKGAWSSSTSASPTRRWAAGFTPPRSAGRGRST